MTDSLEAKVICGATASACICTQKSGHEGPHACGMPSFTGRPCGGKWIGSPGKDDFVVVVYPLIGDTS